MPVPDRALTVWLLSPYHTGSHRAWAEGYARHSRHHVRLLTMEGRFWKWRMQGGVMELARQIDAALAAGPPDVLLTTDMVNLPALLGLVRHGLPPALPVLHYMHENQLTYPWATAGPGGRPAARPDLTYGMINWLSLLCADGVAFNSAFHRESWFAALPNLLKHFPDYTHLDRIEAVRRRSRVLPVGIAWPAAPVGAVQRTADRTGGPPLILWNQRWEYDKRPDRFFALLDRLDAAGVPFRLAVAGENFRNVPQEFVDARERFAARIVHWGYAESLPAYHALLHQADLVISTADHEFFGIAVLEAIAAGAFPLLPRRLSYPELIPADLHPACLYADEDELFEKARVRLLAPRPAPPSLQEHIRRRFVWPAVAPLYDAALANVGRMT
jgi:glycosyltransferase involved in cell wall biosynthesis